MAPIKSIAVPVTRKALNKKPRPAGHPVPPSDSEVGGRVGPPRRQPGPLAAVPMHHFKIGQRMLVRSGSRVLQRPQTICRIVALLPYEGNGVLRYRIRSEVESFERVVDENDLSAT